MGDQEKKKIPEATEDFNEIKTFLSWSAPGRPFKKRTKNYYAMSLLISFLLVVMALLAHELMLALVILSFLFVAMALNTVPPKNFHYKITTGGITIEDHFFLWQELYDFYFKKRFDSIEILHIRTRALLPGEITLTVGHVNKEHIKSILTNYLPYREIITPTFVDKSATWLTTNFPLEGNNSSTVSQKVAS